MWEIERERDQVVLCKGNNGSTPNGIGPLTCPLTHTDHKNTVICSQPPTTPHAFVSLSYPSSHHKYPYTSPSPLSQHFNSPTLLLLFFSPFYTTKTKPFSSISHHQKWPSRNHCLEQQYWSKSSRGAHQAWERNNVMMIMMNKASLWTYQRAILLFMLVKTEADTLSLSLSWTIPSSKTYLKKPKTNLASTMRWVLQFLAKKKSFNL